MTERLSFFGRSALALGSAAIALRNTARGDMVAVLGEVTGAGALTRLRRRVERTPSGLEMVTTQHPARFPAGGTAGLDLMRKLPRHSLGGAYAHFMDSRGFEPESRLPVRFVEDARDAWTLQRYRDVHDLWHVLNDMPTNMLGETAQKWFEAAHTRLPVAGLAAVGGPAKLSARKRGVLARELVPWAVGAAAKVEELVAIRYEDFLERELEEVRELWGVTLPVLRDPTALYGRARKKSER